MPPKRPCLCPRRYGGCISVPLRSMSGMALRRTVSMTGACILVQTPAGRIVPWSPEIAETRGHGDAATGTDQSFPASPRRFSSPCLLSSPASTHRRVIHLGLVEYLIHFFLQGALRHRPNHSLDHLATL